MKLNKIIAIGCIAVSMVCTTYAKEIEAVIQKESEIKEDTVITTVAIVDEAKVRETPSPTGDIICYLNTNEAVVVSERYGDFYKVLVKDDIIGYIYKTQIDTTNLEQVVDTTPQQEEAETLSKGQEIVATAKRYLGGKYVYGGNNLKTGVDCSGLTKEVFETFDINITRLASTQVRDGKIVAKSELRPGDLVFFDTTGKNTGTISHVGIYAGDNMFLHADGTNGVMLSNLNSSYYARNYVTGSRIINS